MYFEDSGSGFRVLGGLKIDQNEHVYDFWAHFIYIQFSKARNVYTFW